MPTNLAIDDRLLEEAQKVGGHRTKRETVTAAQQPTKCDSGLR
jgi:Arc/MetJ family transcription regulator